MTPPDSDFGHERICGHTACPEWGCVVKPDSDAREVTALNRGNVVGFLLSCIASGEKLTDAEIAKCRALSRAAEVSLPLSLAQRILAMLESDAENFAAKGLLTVAEIYRALAAELRAVVPK